MSLFRKIEGYTPEEVEHASTNLIAMHAGRLALEALPATMAILMATAQVILGCCYIPEDKIPQRPRIDTLIPGCESVVRAKLQFRVLLQPIPLDLARMQFLVMLITIARFVTSSGIRFINVVLANLAFWEREAQDMLESVYKKAEPFTREDPNLAEILSAARDHFHEAAERAADTAVRNREIRKESHDEGFKAGEQKALKETQDSKADVNTLLSLLQRTGGNKP